MQPTAIACSARPMYRKIVRNGSLVGSSSPWVSPPSPGPGPRPRCGSGRVGSGPRPALPPGPSSAGLLSGQHGVGPHMLAVAGMSDGARGARDRPAAGAGRLLGRGADRLQDRDLLRREVLSEKASAFVWNAARSTSSTISIVLFARQSSSVVVSNSSTQTGTSSTALSTAACRAACCSGLIDCPLLLVDDHQVGVQLVAGQAHDILDFLDVVRGDVVDRVLLPIDRALLEGEVELLERDLDRRWRPSPRHSSGTGAKAGTASAGPAGRLACGSALFAVNWRAPADQAPRIRTPVAARNPSLSGCDASDVKKRWRWSESSKTKAPSRMLIGAYSALSADAPWMSMSMSPAATDAIRSASPPSWLAPEMVIVTPTSAAASSSAMTWAPHACCGWASL